MTQQTQNQNGLLPSSHEEAKEKTVTENPCNPTQTFCKNSLPTACIDTNISLGTREITISSTNSKLSNIFSSPCTSGKSPTSDILFRENEANSARSEKLSNQTFEENKFLTCIQKPLNDQPNQDLAGASNPQISHNESETAGQHCASKAKLKFPKFRDSLAAIKKKKKLNEAELERCTISIDSVEEEKVCNTNEIPASNSQVHDVTSCGSLKRKSDLLDEEIAEYFGRSHGLFYVFWVKRGKYPYNHILTLFCSREEDSLNGDYTQKITINEKVLDKSLMWMLNLYDRGIGILGRETNWESLKRHDWEKADPDVKREDPSYDAVVDVIDVIEKGQIRHFPELWILRWHCQGMGSATIQQAEKSGPIFILVRAFKKAREKQDNLAKVNLWTELPCGSQTKRTNRQKRDLIKSYAKNSRKYDNKHKKVTTVNNRTTKIGRPLKTMWKQTAQEKKGIDSLRTSECCLFLCIDSIFHSSCKVYRSVKKGCYDASTKKWGSEEFKSKFDENMHRNGVNLSIERCWYWCGKSKIMKNILKSFEDLKNGQSIVLYRGCGLPHAGVIEIPEFKASKFYEYENATSDFPKSENEQTEFMKALELEVCEALVLKLKVIK